MHLYNVKCAASGKVFPQEIMLAPHYKLFTEMQWIQQNECNHLQCKPQTYVVLPIFFLINVFIALKGTHFLFLLAGQKLLQHLFCPLLLQLVTAMSC